MLKPTIRLFIDPLGAICTIASMASQPAPRTSPRTGDTAQIRQDVVDCGQLGARTSDICVIAAGLSR